MSNVDFIVTLIALSFFPLFFVVFIMLVLFSSKKEIIKERIKDQILIKRKNIFGLIILAMLTVISPIMSIPYWRDLPYVATKKYPVAEGIITDEIYISGRDRHTLITINHITYTFYGSEYPSVGKLVNIKYLPNTKIIYTITEK